MASSLTLWAFAADAPTERVVRRALTGRTATKVQRAKWPEALRLLAEAPSPQLVLVDLDGAPDPEAAFRQLRTVCSFETSFVALGSSTTSGFARQRLRDGFADYLVKPASIVDVQETCASLLDDPMDRGYAGRVLCFAGSGGSGVSSLVRAVARESRARDRACVILSLDPVRSDSFGLEPSGDVAELLAGLESGNVPDFDPFGQAGGNGDSRVALVAYANAAELSASPRIDTVLALVSYLANRAATVLVAGVPQPEVLVELMRQADVRVVSYEPALASINVAVRCLALLGEDHATLLVQCHSRARRSYMSAAQIRYALADRDPDVTLPHDAALSTKEPSVEVEPRYTGRYQKALTQALALIFEHVP